MQYLPGTGFSGISGGAAGAPSGASGGDRDQNRVGKVQGAAVWHILAATWDPRMMESGLRIALASIQDPWSYTTKFTVLSLLAFTLSALSAYTTAPEEELEPDAEGCQDSKLLNRTPGCKEELWKAKPK
jgi:hypothetical protein